MEITPHNGIRLGAPTRITIECNEDGIVTMGRGGNSRDIILLLIVALAMNVVEFKKKGRSLSDAEAEIVKWLSDEIKIFYEEAADHAPKTN